MKGFAHTTLNNEGAENTRVASHVIALEVHVVKMLGVMESTV